jgi:polysaccharide pyruvyl transferase WcaK-like protein
MTNRQTTESPPFLLVSVGSYRNRGCEAIVRGTMEILRQQFGPEVRARAGVVGSREVVRSQSASEIDPAVNSFALSPPPGGPRWSLGWFEAQANQRLGTAFYPHLKDLKEQVQSAPVALEVGGDNYSLDYGKPVYYLAMDRYLQSREVPVMLWGASVGPFHADPVFARRMFDHLRSLSAIFVRENNSFDYLRANGVSDNVHLMADPAFVMKPVEPPAERIGFTLPEGAIGINLSPMIAFYRGRHPAEVDLKEWLAFCVGLVKSVATLQRPILLIPHVGSPDPGNDDFNLLRPLCKAVESTVPVPVQVLPRGLNAAECKWIIARCAVFAGARTHSTIAALSSHVPTLSIGYSLKSKGINRDVYGHLDHCLHVSELTSENFTEHLRVLLATESAIRAHLQSRIPELQMRAMRAGAMLRKITAAPSP